MRQCLFCLSKADSVEDAWPRWITKQFRGARPSEVDAERFGVKLPKWRTYQPKLAVRCVCGACNQGWMSQLETEVQPILQPLLTGKPYVLTPRAQATVARWTVKTAMVLDGLDEANRQSYTERDREQMRTRGDIPWRTTVWLAASADAAWFMSTKNRHMDGGPAHDIAGVSITMAFAHVAMQVMTMRVPETVGPTTRVTANVKRGPWDETTVRVFPESPETSWPPTLGLNGEMGLEFLADRFNTTAMDAEAIDTMAV